MHREDLLILVNGTRSEEIRVTETISRTMRRRDRKNESRGRQKFQAQRSRSDWRLTLPPFRQHPNHPLTPAKWEGVRETRRVTERTEREDSRHERRWWRSIRERGSRDWLVGSYGGSYGSRTSRGVPHLLRSRGALCRRPLLRPLCNEGISRNPPRG